MIAESKDEENNKKRSKLSTNSKSRTFLRLRRNYNKFIVIITLPILIFAAFSITKALVIQSNLKDIQAFSSDYVTFSEEASCVFKILHEFKYFLNIVVKGSVPTANQITNFGIRFKELNASIDFILPVQEQIDEGVSYLNSGMLQKILIGDLCNLVPPNEQGECMSLFEGVLSKGYLTIRYDLFTFINNYFSRFKTIKANAPANLTAFSLELINNQDFKSYLTAWTMLQTIIFDWLTEAYGDMQTKTNNGYIDV